MPAPKPEDLGPLAGLVGTWEGDDGLDVSFHNPATRDAKTFTMTAEFGSETYGILSNRYLAKAARTTRYEVTITLGDDTWSYDETTVVDLTTLGRVLAHTDRNTLHRVP